ncbi:ATP-dependent DNA ligase [Patescibacteria group bacterium]|nr:ATP-dependent DNA ligase [Patescibacteria group bacterium]
MTFKKLASFLDALEKTASRIEITKILAKLFDQTDATEIGKTVNLLLGQLAPSYEGVVFNLAERMMLQVLAKAYSADLTYVKKIYKEKGDMGEVVFELSQRLKKITKNLSVSEVYEKLLQIAKDEGEKSVERKIEKMAKLLSELDPLSAKFVARIPVGRLRLGFSDKTVLDALSWMETGNKSKKSKLEKAYQVVPDVGKLSQKVKNLGVEAAVEGIKPVVGIPVMPMLAQRIKSPSEMVTKMGKVFVEPKFDGLRVLIHYKKKENFIRAFTRNLNDVADMFPELSQIGKYLDVREAILDTEAVGMDPEMLRLADFQTTMKRRRKYDIDTKSREIPLRFQVFDVIFLDGKSLMDEPYYERRKELERIVKKNNLLVVDEAVLTEDSGVITKLHKEKTDEGLEGIIVKKYDANYVPGRTGWRWVKMKQGEEALGKLSDTLDCVVMGYYAGRGKRTVFGLGGFLVGILDGEVIKTITKIGTGLKDEQFKEMYKRLKKLGVRSKPKDYGEVGRIILPDFWVEPSLVVEVAADEITKSPIHSSGLALRFPRLVKFRDDKSAKQASTLSEVKKILDIQKR